MKPLSETRKENREEFEKFFLSEKGVLREVTSLIGLQKFYRNSTPESVKSFLSSAEYRILSAVKEKIEGMMKEEEHECHMMCCGSCGCQDKPEMNEIDRAKADLLSDLKSFIEEGMNTK